MIIFFGIAGSGKGTQAATLSKRTGWPTLSSGEVLRQNTDDPSIKAALAAGQLVSDEKLIPLLEQEFNRIGAAKNEFILDGSPRNINQARWLVEKIKEGKLMLSAIIHIKLSEQVAQERLALRGRSDDDSKAMVGRFKFYEESVMPAMRYLEAQGYEINEIDGDVTPEEVATSIRRILETKNAG